MNTLGVILAMIVGVGGACVGWAGLMIAAVLFSGELGETDNNRRRGRWVNAAGSFGLTALAVAVAGFIAGALTGLLPQGAQWWIFAGIALACFIVTTYAMLAMYGLLRREVKRR